jgi:asparagine synthase (glutamine-hydrolysing)
MRRFIAVLACDTPIPIEERQALDRARADASLDLLVDSENLVLAVAPEVPRLRLRTSTGFVLGMLFGRHAPGPVTDLSEAEERSIITSGGNRFLQRYWGNYIAIVPLPDGIAVVRPPFGDLPLVYARHGPLLFAASDIELLEACGCGVHAIDWNEIARHLAASDIRRTETCLEGVNELRGGDRLSVSAGTIKTEPLWSPWVVSNGEAGIADFSVGTDEVRRSIDWSIKQYSTCFERPLLLLSGGLDSSILACSLYQAKSTVTALNFVTEDPSGDERIYAQLVASAVGIDYVEAERNIANVDPCRSDAAGLPRPSVRSFMQDSRRAMEAAAAQIGADAILEGGGGDNVFCSLQSVAPLADRIRSGGSLREIMASARDIAILSDATLSTVLRRAYHRAWLRPTSYRQQPDLDYLSKDGIRAARGATRHPWLDAPRGAPPGKIAHAALLVAGQSWVECFDPCTRVPTHCPLLAQPVVETCFRVPSWMWFTNGQNRVVAREAFRGRLPDPVIDRRSKATPDSFITKVFERYRPAIKELLLEGRLAAEGLVDRTRLERTLAEASPPRNNDHRRIMRLADAEAWIQARLRSAASERRGPGEAVPSVDTAISSPDPDSPCP